MENGQKLVKVYSNNSKKSRLKRKKNKFQRIWDAENEKYIKIRKKPAMQQHVKSEEDDFESKMKALERRQLTHKKPVRIPVQPARVKNKQTVEPESKPVAKVSACPKTSAVKIYKISGIDYLWDNKTLKYKKAA